MLDKLSLIPEKVDRIYLAVNMAVSLFPKCYKNTGILSKQTPTKNRIVFVLYCLFVLPIGPCYSLVEEQQLLFPCGRTMLPLALALDHHDQDDDDYVVTT